MKILLIKIFLFLVITSSLSANYKIQQQVSENQESIEGVLSIIDGYSSRLYELEQKVFELNKNNEKFLSQLNYAIEQIESSYVTKEELKVIIEKVSNNINEEKFLSKSNKELLKDGINLFSQKKYKEAKVRFERTAKKNYKLATSSFYLGEIAYYQENYKLAIKHYDISANLYSKAKYMSKLMYHTAYSLEQLGNIQEAKKFYESVISMYSTSKYVAYAKKRLKRLNK